MFRTNERQKRKGEFNKRKWKCATKFLDICVGILYFYTAYHSQSHRNIHKKIYMKRDNNNKPTWFAPNAYIHRREISLYM